MDTLEMLSGKHNIAANNIITIIIIATLMMNWLTLSKSCLTKCFFFWTTPIPYVINQFMLALIVIIKFVKSSRR